VPQRRIGGSCTEHVYQSLTLASYLFVLRQAGSRFTKHFLSAYVGWIFTDMCIHVFPVPRCNDGCSSRENQMRDSFR
jgi:hypothetical protein